MPREIQSPALKYHGSKFKLARWYASMAPKHTTRVIACAGGLGELLGTEDWPIEGVAEVVNDTNKQVTEFWTVISNVTMFRSFIWLASNQPLSEITFKQRQDYLKSKEIVYRAFGFFVTMRMGQQGSQKEPTYATPTRRLRRGMNENVSAWLSSVEGLAPVHTRLKRVEVRNTDCQTCITQYDHPEAFHFIDPPYLIVDDNGRQIRTSGGGEYINEWTAIEHLGFLEFLAHIKGKFMLCGYMSEMYSRFALAHGWRCERKLVVKSSSRKSVKPVTWEYVWMNYQPPSTLQICPPL